MERGRKLDAAGVAGAPLIGRCAIVVLLLGASLSAQVRMGERLEEIKKLFAAENWQEVVRLAESAPAASADLDFYHGSALARLERWDEARKIFAAGARLDPQDERFPVELAGVAFKQKHYGEAARHLRRALGLAPQDAYANDFLGTVYFLRGNLEAALKYWNRAGKPTIQNIVSDPLPKVDAQLLDRAFAFAPASTLKLPDLWTTQARLNLLGIFPAYHLELQAREDGRFDVAFRNRELDGWGANRWQALVLLLRGLPAQSVYPAYFDLKGRALNFTSMYRWDAQKRRVRADFAGPVRGDPARHFDLGMDWREENWNLQQSFTGPASSLGALRLRRSAVRGRFDSVVNGRWSWSAGGEFSHRDFEDVLAGSTLTPGLLAKGFQLKQVSRVNAVMWRTPERRITISAGATSELGRIWSQPSHTFEKLQISLRWHWLPRAQGDDYEMQYQIRGGKTWGAAPFDELFTLGLDADNELWMRGHIATRDGKKGSAPMGRSYFLSNWEQDKNLYSNGLFALKAGPFVDTGKITDAVPVVGRRQWLWDVGAQAKVKAFGAQFVVSYGKDLRSGSNAIYVTLR